MQMLVLSYMTYKTYKRGHLRKLRGGNYHTVQM